MNIEKILVVFKRTAFEIYKERTSRIIKAHEEHQRSLDAIAKELKRLGIEHLMVDRVDIHETGDFDFVVTVGGDGTLLRASHFIEGVPVLGVNSSPATSVGRLCGATARNFGKLMKLILKDHLKGIELQRILISINGIYMRELALNDVLICDRNPARITRYRINLGKISEDQKCSGIWISTPSGSTAAICSSGGRKMQLSSKRLQFLVREPYLIKGKKYRLVSGFIELDRVLQLVSEMREGYIFIDGPDVSYPIQLGATVECKPSNKPLYVFGIG